MLHRVNSRTVVLHSLDASCTEHSLSCDSAKEGKAMSLISRVMTQQRPHDHVTQANNTLLRQPLALLQPCKGGEGEALGVVHSLCTQAYA